MLGASRKIRMQPEFYSMNDLRDYLNISSDLCDKLEIYHNLLIKWQTAINLVSFKTVKEAWYRHFLDSSQLLKYASETKIAVDLGSGAGFPGLVFSVLNNNTHMNLVESDQRKCEFLRAVSRETGANVSIHNERIEKFVLTSTISPDLAMARALAPLSKLLDYVAHWAMKSPDFTMIFLKGSSYKDEISDAKRFYSFDYDVFPSVTDKEAAVIRIHSLRK